MKHFASSHVKLNLNMCVQVEMRGKTMVQFFWYCENGQLMGTLVCVMDIGNGYFQYRITLH